MKKRKLMPPSPLPSGQFAARVVPAVQDCGGQGREQVWPGREGHGQGVHRARRHGDPRALACHDGKEAQQEPVREDHGQGAVQHVRFDAVQRARFEFGNCCLRQKWPSGAMFRCCTSHHPTHIYSIASYCFCCRWTMYSNWWVLIN